MGPPTMYPLTHTQAVNTPPLISCIDKDTLDSSIWIRVLLAFICFIYVAFAISGVYFYRLGGFAFDGDIGTLTTVLAISGVVLNLLSLGLSGQCRSAGLQSISKAAIDRHVTLARLETMDIAVNGSMLDVLKRPGSFGILYQLGLPALAILSSVVWKKTLSTGFSSVPVAITGYPAAYVNPTNISSGMRGASWPAAIIYNTTTSVGNRMNALQQSWTYVIANASDDTGLASITYSMPSLPWLVGQGSAGYQSYYARSVPAAMADVYCSDGQYDVNNFSHGIQNGNNWLSLGVQDGSVIMQVNTSAGVVWSCAADMNNVLEDVTFASDGGGNWNVSSAVITRSSPISFQLTNARWSIMSGMISDVLGTTAGYSGWVWGTSTYGSPGYASMLTSARLGLAVAALGYSSDKVPSPSVAPDGEASLLVEQVVLLAQWPLVVLIVCLGLQAVISFYHLFIFGKHCVDFNIIQTMEMQDAATRAGIGCDIDNYCSEQGRKSAAGEHRVKIRIVNNGVLGLVSGSAADEP
ncbi:hypothetical protein KCV03_g9820, partial [Aureobasidium melanogenum]